MNALTILEVVSPLIAATGGAVLTYDAVRDPLKWWARRGYAAAERREAAVHRAELLPLTSPPYPSAEAAPLITDENARHASAVSAIQDASNRAELEMSFGVQRRAVWGFVLVTVGCLLQAIVPLLRKG